jgi:hypothetical protein
MRLNYGDNMFQAITKVSEGNPGAIVAIMKIAEVYSKVDPKHWIVQAAPSSIAGGVAMMFDDHEIYGPNIHILFKDVCGLKPERVIVLFRAHQLGFSSLSNFKDFPHLSIDFDDLIARIKAEVPDFNP